MKPSASSSASSTAATSASGSISRERSAASRAQVTARPAAPKLSESEYLKKQADDATAALRATLQDLTSTVTGTVNIAAWAKQYPWIASGAAMAAGFAAACAVVPDATDTAPEAKSRWKKVKEAWAGVLHPERAAAEAKDRAAEVEDRAPRAAEGPGWAASLLRELFTALRPVLIGLITGMMRGPQPPPDGHANGDPVDTGASTS